MIEEIKVDRGLKEVIKTTYSRVARSNMMEVGEKIRWKTESQFRRNACHWWSQRDITQTSVFGAHRGTLHKTSVFGAHRGGTTRKDKDGREMMNEIMEDIF